jgi:hypothetical protein
MQRRTLYWLAFLLISTPVGVGVAFMSSALLPSLEASVLTWGLALGFMLVFPWHRLRRLVR